MAALLRLIPYLVAINSWSLELEFSEANHFGKVNKAVCFAVIKLFASLFKMSKCKMVMGFGMLHKIKAPAPPLQLVLYRILWCYLGHHWSRSSSLK